MNSFENEIIAALKKYEYLADNVLNGDFSLADCKAVRNEEGVFDENFENRKRLIAVMTAIRPDAILENIVKRLFEAETESCRVNSFGGYDDALETLTAMLWEFNSDGRYNKLFEEAKNANFDCACGYEPYKKYSYERGTDFIKKLSAGDCANYLYFDLYMTDNIENILDIIEQEYSESFEELEKISYLNECLSRKSHNYKFRLMELDKALKSGADWDISSAYSGVINSIIDNDEKQAYNYFEKSLPYLFNIDEWYDCGLGFDFMEFAAVFIVKLPIHREKLWKDWEMYIKSNCEHSKVCTEAAKIMDVTDSLRPELKA